MSYQHLTFNKLPISTIVFMSFLIATGCDSSTQSRPVAIGHPQAIGSPTDICKRILDAVDRDDKELVVSLVAQKKVADDVQALTKGRRGFDKFKGNAAGITAAAIIMDLKMLQPASRKIKGESITNGQAEVTVVGINNDGKELTKLVHFVHEGSAWKLIPSQRKL